MNKQKTLILGLGNDILTDDGIGPRLVHDLTKVNFEQDVSFNIACCGGLEIMEFIKGYNKVIFIDAIRTLKGKPGQVYSFKISDFRETCHLSNLHDINFLTALKLSQKLDLYLPADLHIIGIEILEDMEFSEEISIPLNEAYPIILKKVSSIVKKILEA